MGITFHSRGLVKKVSGTISKNIPEAVYLGVSDGTILDFRALDKKCKVSKIPFMNTKYFIDTFKKIYKEIQVQ